MIRDATRKDIAWIKSAVDEKASMDTIPQTFPREFYTRLVDQAIVLVYGDNEGVAFGTYNEEEGWADLLGVVSVHDDKNVIEALAVAFEKRAVKLGVTTIDYYSHESDTEIFKKLQYTIGQTYTAVRKAL